ncbi:Hydantoinase/oxoprolinase family protein [Rhodovulum sulfidophilum]|uniref:Hydantoinase/oxoprolinase family protein n=1 Tax=Rhodovulum sulfidophilum TaxID=35806 RepID=A0A0D6B1Q8_RHOSU|nr:Hydantoinase/oxoprolinase family protein [Rhodovulum sulfidophilum]
MKRRTSRGTNSQPLRPCHQACQIRRELGLDLAISVKSESVPKTFWIEMCFGNSREMISKANFNPGDICNANMGTDGATDRIMARPGVAGMPVVSLAYRSCSGQGRRVRPACGSGWLRF